MFDLLFLLSAAAVQDVPAADPSIDQAVETALSEVGEPSAEPDIVVVTAARAPQSQDEVGRAVTVIDRAEIDRRQAVNIADLLATTPGVTATRNGSLGKFTGVRLRGAEAEQTLVVIDGVRVNDPSSPGGGFDFANLLSSNVERVEVLRGPNSVPWGSQAIGGVVNVVTGLPRPGVQARARAEYGYADTAYADAGLSGSNGTVSAALTGGYLRSDGISAAEAGSERDGYRQYGASGRLGVEVTSALSLDLRVYHANSRTEFDGFTASGLGDTADFQKTRELYAYAGVNLDLLDGRFHNRAAFTLADVDRDSLGGDFPFVARGRSERFEYQADFRPIDAVRVVAGIEREDSRFRSRSAFENARASTGVTSGYAQLIVKPLDVLTINGGVRHDDHDAYGGETTVGADAALALPGGTTIRASYGEGFKAPTLYQLYGPYGTGTLEPERARSYDAGVEQSFLVGRARASATWFRRRTTDQIDFDLGSFTYRNIARTRGQGVELALALRPVERLTVTGQYSYVRAENRSPGAVLGNDLARRPRHSVAMNADYRFPFGLSLGGTLVHVGDSYDDLANTVRLDGYVLASVRAEMPVGDRFAVYGRVENLTDERYQTVSGYGTFGRAAYGGVRVRLN